MPSKLTKFLFPSSRYVEKVSEEAKKRARRRTEETSRRLQSIETEIRLEGYRARPEGNQ